MTIVTVRPNTLCGSLDQHRLAFSPVPQLCRTRRQIFDRDIQPISVLDAIAHMLRLTAADRYLRFGVSMSDDSICAYVSQADACGGLTLGYSDQGHVRGIVEVRPTIDRFACVELAVTVESDWRGRGCGTCLVRCALAVVPAMPAERVVAMISRANRDMRTIAAKLGATITSDCDGLNAEWLLIQDAGADARA
jgi:GNAT superfamily N-acetyltransferase